MNDSIIKSEADKILSTKKYRHICRATLEDVIRLELGKYRKPKEALKSAKTKIHQIWAGYLGIPDYNKMNQALREAIGDTAQEKEICLEILSAHMSTKERIEILDDFYAFLFGHTGEPEVILDLACALNPFSLPWMNLPPSVQYHGYDINALFVDFLNGYFSLRNMAPLAMQCDVLLEPPAITGDVAFLFKMYHCLEKRQRGAGLQVLKQTKASWIAITFPTRNLANRETRITQNYEETIEGYVQEMGWKLIRNKFATEELFLIRTDY